MTAREHREVSRSHDPMDVVYVLNLCAAASFTAIQRLLDVARDKDTARSLHSVRTRSCCHARVFYSFVTLYDCCIFHYLCYCSRTHFHLKASRQSFSHQHCGLSSIKPFHVSSLSFHHCACRITPAVRLAVLKVSATAYKPSSTIQNTHGLHSWTNPPSSQPQSRATQVPLNPLRFQHAFRKSRTPQSCLTQRETLRVTKFAQSRCRSVADPLLYPCPHLSTQSRSRRTKI
jgi:hypothetical protein